MEVRLTWIQRFLTSFALLSFLNLSDGKPNIEKRCSTCREITKSFNEVRNNDDTISCFPMDVSVLPFSFLFSEADSDRLHLSMNFKSSS